MALQPKNISFFFFSFCLFTAGFFLMSRPPHSHAQPPDTTPRLIPIGASYELDTLTAVSAEILARDTDNLITIRVLPITYASNPTTITAAERANNLATAQGRADEILAACNTLITLPFTCVVTVPDIQVQADANDAALVNATLGSDVDGVFILGGDQTIAMQVVANSLAETALATLYAAGVPIAGTSAGAGVQSRWMIAGYTGSNGAADGLEFGAVDVWYGDMAGSQRGLSFGLNTAVIEQHVLERGRLCRLLQAAQRLPTGTPHIGLGVDWGTTAEIDDQQLIPAITGAYASVVVDEESYNAAETAVYTGTAQWLSIHNTALHVLPPGPYGYDLVNRQPLVNNTPQAAPDISARSFGPLAIPSGAGTLFIAGDLSNSATGPAISQFATIAQATGLPVMVLAVGYPGDLEAVAAANYWRTRLLTLGVSTVLARGLVDISDLAVLNGELDSVGAVLVMGDDQESVANWIDELNTLNLRQRWLDGTVMLLDHAAAAAAGSWMAAEPTPTGATLEIQSSDSFLTDTITIQPGLNFLPNVVFEPRLLTDYRYGRLISHLYHHNNLLAIGLERGAALQFTPTEVTVLGIAPVMVIDGRYATHISNGTNTAVAATWLLLDTFAPNETVAAFSPTNVQLSGITVSTAAKTVGVWVMGVMGTAVLTLLTWFNRKTIG